MRRTLIAAAALTLAATFVASAAAAPNDSPFPSLKVVDVFVAAQTVTTDGTMANQFAPGSTVVFRAYATLPKTRDILVAKDVRYFYIAIPNQPNVKLKYDPSARGASARMPWTGTWQVPANYRPGLVPFKALIQTTKKLRGVFVQFPVTSAMLTISATPQIVTGPATTPGTVTPLTEKQDLSLYADTVNGTRPAAAKPRPVGCTQSNVFKRGEQVVVRSWGVDLTAGSTLLTNETVEKAVLSVSGVAPITMSWGPHGPADARVFFWVGVWNVAADFPLGDVTLRITYTTFTGKTASFDHPLTIIP